MPHPYVAVLLVVLAAGQNITGPLPSEIGTLPFLQAIALYNNVFTGTIPHSYADMKQLVSIELDFNALTGTVPDAFWRADALQQFNVAGNFLSGTISSEVAQMSNMAGLFLFDNR